MPAPSLPWTDAMVADAADRLRARPDLSGRILHRIAAAYGLHGYQQGLRDGAGPVQPRTLHLNGCDGAEVWTSSQDALMGDPVAGLSSFLRAVEAARPA